MVAAKLLTEKYSLFSPHPFKVTLPPLVTPGEPEFLAVAPGE